MSSKNFALLGVGGYVAPRHLQAIERTGNRLLAACDPSDSVGVLDRYFLDTKFFTEVERFDRFLEKQKRRGEQERIHFTSICTPNYLHDAHVRLSLRCGADAICEKPLVINPWNLDQLEEIESETGGRVYSVLQLRLLPALRALRERFAGANVERKAQIDLRYIARRGPWYQISWKGQSEKSGGLALNIGVHFFDMLQWIFGPADEIELHCREADRWSGYLSLPRADVRWYLSTRVEDLPRSHRDGGLPAFRSLRIDDEEVEFSKNFADLHTRIYEEVLAGRGFGVQETRPSIELVYRLRTVALSSKRDRIHELLKAS